MKKFEYKIIEGVLDIATFSVPSDTEELFNSMGNDGWEIVTCLFEQRRINVQREENYNVGMVFGDGAIGTIYIATFKREIE